MSLTSAETKELFLVYDLLKTLSTHFPKSMKLRGTIDARLESVLGVILPAPWRPMSEYKGWGEVRVRMVNGEENLAHWASDLSGSEQPAFEGWFEKVRDGLGEVSYCREIDAPIAWCERDSEYENKSFVSATS